MRKFKGQKGLSLVEVTIMLLVLMLLTSVLAPSIFDVVIDAKWVKVKEDCEAIGITVARMVRDVGPCFKFNGVTACDEANRVDILYSDGPDVTAADVIPIDYSSNNITPSAINWDNDSDALVGDWMEDQFATNAPLYNTPSQNYPAPLYPVGPLFGIGWRGAYLAPPIGPDPWGKRYLVNSVFLGTAVDSNSAVDEGYYTRWWERDVFCISPGPNGLYETFFGGCTTDHGTCRTGDDFVYVIQGSGR
jgi:type II secretory pathway pseudopilin PulG